MQQNKYPSSSVTPIGIQTDQPKITIIESMLENNTKNNKMMIIVIMKFRMIVVNDNIKNNNNG